MKKSFTIVELLIVMAVISILLGLVVTGIQQAQINARTTERNNTVLEFKAALESYYNDYRTYPPSDDIVYNSDTGILGFNKPNEDGQPLVYKIKVAAYLTEISNANPENCSAENWKIRYQPIPDGATRPQKYELKYCSERGISNEMGNNL